MPPIPRATALVTVARLALVAGLIAWLTVSFDWTSSWHLLQQTRLTPVAASVVIMLAALGTNTLRWYLLLATSGRAPTLYVLYRYQLAGLFASNVLPSSIGGDTYRAYLLVKSGYEYAQAFASVIVDRAYGACLLFALGLWGAVVSLSQPWETGATHTALLGLCLCLAVLAVLALSPSWYRSLEHVPLIGHTVRAFGAAGHRYLGRPRTVLIVLGISLASNAANIAVAYFLASAVGAEVSWLNLAAVTMVVSALSALPISINGYGVAEASWLVLLSGIGVEPGAAGAVAILWRITKLGVSLAGGLALLGLPRAVAQSKAESRY